MVNPTICLPSKNFDMVQTGPRPGKLCINMKHQTRPGPSQFCQLSQTRLEKGGGGS